MDGRPKVLFVDDDLLLVKAVELISRNLDYEFHLTTSVREARIWIRLNKFQIVFSDFHMPELNGVEFLAEVAQFCPCSYRVLVSASLHDEQAKEALNEKHIHAFLKKPFGRADFDQLLLSGMQEIEGCGFK